MSVLAGHALAHRGWCGIAAPTEVGGDAAENQCLEPITNCRKRFGTNSMHLNGARTFLELMGRGDDGDRATPKRSDRFATDITAKRPNLLDQRVRLLIARAESCKVGFPCAVDGKYGCNSNRLSREHLRQCALAGNPGLTYSRVAKIFSLSAFCHRLNSLTGGHVHDGCIVRGASKIREHSPGLFASDRILRTYLVTGKDTAVACRSLEINIRQTPRPPSIRMNSRQVASAHGLKFLRA